MLHIAIGNKSKKDSNTDDLLTVADSNSFLSPEEILPIARENCLEIF